MTAVLSPPPATTPGPATGQELHDEIALIACGRAEGKLRACASCDRKAERLREVASSDRPRRHGRVAAAICGSVVGDACSDCTTKATEILAVIGLEER